MVQELRINERLVIPAAELQWRFSRASGPGGQGVNTTDSRVELLFDVEGSRVLGPFRKARLREQLASRLQVVASGLWLLRSDRSGKTVSGRWRVWRIGCARA